MSLFQWNWLRKIIRRHTRPIAHQTAATWKERLSIIYMLAAWNAFGFVLYSVFQGKADWAKFHGLSSQEGTPAQQWTKTLGIKDATVYRISGFNVHKYEIHNEVDERGKVIETKSGEEETVDESQENELVY